MSRRTSRWKWPSCTLLALSLGLAAAWLIPREWIFLLPGAARPGGGRAWTAPWGGLVLMPPPQIEIVADDDVPDGSKRRPPASPALPGPPVVPAEDPRWWTGQWRLADLDQSRRALLAPPAAVARPTASDSVAALLRMLNVTGDLLTSARPDSLLRARLLWASLQESFSLQDLKPYLSAMARAQDYADIQANAADLYDDFLRQEIRTPD